MSTADSTLQSHSPADQCRTLPVDPCAARLRLLRLMGHSDLVPGRVQTLGNTAGNEADATIDSQRLEDAGWMESQRPLRVLFLCTHNSARNQMAGGWLRHLHGDRFEAHSAGTQVTSVRPLAVRAMAEVGVDISRQHSKSLELYLLEPWDYMITVCDDANDVCPVFPGGKHKLHWSLPDPSKATGTEEEQLAAYTGVHDRIREYIQSLASASPSGKSTGNGDNQ